VFAVLRRDQPACRTRQRAFCLFDDAPAVQRGLKLFVDHLAAVDGAFGQDPDRRDVGQGKVCGEVVRVGGGTGSGSEGFVAQPQPQCVDGAVGSSLGQGWESVRSPTLTIVA
jgi:hypothetical protein